MATARVTVWPQSMMPAGILQITDLPEIYEALSVRMPFEIMGYSDNLLKKSL
jgi:hypothetical protein